MQMSLVLFWEPIMQEFLLCGEEMKTNLGAVPCEVYWHWRANPDGWTFEDSIDVEESPSLWWNGLWCGRESQTFVCLFTMFTIQFLAGCFGFPHWQWRVGWNQAGGPWGSQAAMGHSHFGQKPDNYCPKWHISGDIQVSSIELTCMSQEPCYPQLPRIHLV